MRWLKRVAVVFLGVILLLAGWIYVGSIDDATFDDRGLLSELKPVPDAENGFLEISFLGQENYDFCGISTDRIRSYALGNKWNITHAEKLASNCANVVEAVISSNKKNGFMLPKVKSNINAKFPPYINLITANRLLIIQSRLNAQNFDYGSAVRIMGDAIIFSEHVRHDAKGSILLWMIGAVMQGENLSWLHELVTNYDMPDTLQRKVLKEIQKVQIFNDGFIDSLYGEYSYSINFINSFKYSNFSEKMQYYNETKKTMKSFGEDFSLDKKAFLVLSLLFSEYYIHPNFTASRFAELIRSSMDRYGGFCPKFNDALGHKLFPMVVNKPGWRDFLEPNSVGNTWLLNDLGEYFARRCLFQVYATSVQAAVALRMYSENHGRGLPKSLDKLVPDYLDRVPLDYFDGQPLRYSLEKEWLYSIGADHRDDGGSSSGFYTGRCAASEPCFNSPTIPLVARQAMHQ